MEQTVKFEFTPQEATQVAEALLNAPTRIGMPLLNKMQQQANAQAPQAQAPQPAVSQETIEAVKAAQAPATTEPAVEPTR